MTDDIVLTLTDLEYCGEGKARCIFSDKSRPNLAPVRVVVALKPDGSDLEQAIAKAADVAIDRFAGIFADLKVKGLMESKLESGPKVVYTGKLADYKKGGGNK